MIRSDVYTSKVALERGDVSRCTTAAAWYLEDYVREIRQILRRVSPKYDSKSYVATITACADLIHKKVMHLTSAFTVQSEKKRDK